PIEQTLKRFEDDILNKGSRIAVIESDGKIVGFCKADLQGDLGIIEYLVVLESYRGQGYGAELMNWAMKTFESANTRNIEVKVADGNNAVTLYEKYGFKMNAHILKLYR
ncbi:MAG: GNAT family N-acetyltransferase, partial [Ruminococcus sp.]|nr:GNAT family N-acetyltransferase [Ruminococcus sp.]